MTDWSQSTYLDFTGYGLTLATPAQGSGQSDVEAAFGITDGKEVTGDKTTVTVALTLNRAKDPSTLLSSNWATRQTMLTQADAQGGVGVVYGASQQDYNTLANDLKAKGLSVVTDTNVSSAESRTVWVTLDAAQFKSLFGTPLMQGSQTIEPANFDTTPGGYTDTKSTTILYWNGALTPDVSVPLAGMWIEHADSTGDIAATPTPVITDPVAVDLPNGKLGIGNSATPYGEIYPNALAAIYSFPLQGSSLHTNTVGIVAQGVGTNVGVEGDTIANYVQGYLTLAGVTGNTGKATVTEGTTEAPTAAPSSGERSLDVSVVAATAPNSNQVLYAGDAHGPFSAMQEAIWDDKNTLGALTSSFSEQQRPAPGSPFYAAYQGLMEDAALRNISVFTSVGDGGSSEKIGNGVPMSDISHDSPYAVVVGGTSLSSLSQASTDDTLKSVVDKAVAHDKATLLGLVAGGLTTLPAKNVDVASFIETTWNDYKNKNGTTNGLTGNLADAGGVDPAFTEPDYQVAYGLDIAGMSYNGQQTGRGVPDVAAMSEGNTFYNVLNANPSKHNTDVANTHADGGTSAAAPLWAALTVQIQAIFKDQGLPTTGYFNDLLYTAAAIAPGSFNDVTLGNATSSFVYGGTTTDKSGKDTYHITPTGIGYAAGPGYDLTTGLGTPNGILLARALTQIAQAQEFSASATPVSDATGLTSTANQALIVQATPVTGAVDVTAAGTAFRASAGTIPGWSARVAQQVLRSGFDPNLVAAISGAAQAGAAQVTVTTGQSLATTIGGTAASPTGQADTAAFGFVTTVDGTGNTVTYARPLAVAETYGGQNGTEAILRIRQTSAHDDSLTLYRVDDLLGDIDGIAPGQAGYANAAKSRAYATQDGLTNSATPPQADFSQTNVEGVDNGAIIGFSLTDNTAGQTYWGLAGQNADGADALWSYGANTWGFNDGSADGSFADTVFQLDFTSNAGSGLVASDAAPACYVAGTSILTPTGERPVEALVAGDLVTTASGQARPVLWIGTRSYAGRFLRGNPGVLPVRIRAGALGGGLPRRDLLVSPEHAMLLDGVLIPARLLVNGGTIRHEPTRDRVDYFHIELDQHDVILAEGAASETFLDDGSRGVFHNAATFTATDAAASRATCFCAPRLTDGEQLQQILHRLMPRMHDSAAA